VKKLLARVLIVVICLVGVGYFASGYALDLASQRLIALFPRYGKQLGVRLISPTYKRVRFSSFQSIAWEGVECSLGLADHGRLNKSGKLKVQIRSLELSALDLSLEKFALAGEQILFQSVEENPLAGHSAAGDLAAARFVGDYFRLRFNRDQLDLIPAAKRLVRDLFSLARTGKTTAPIELSGEAEFAMGNSFHRARIYTVKQDQETLVVLDKGDLKSIADASKLDLTLAEIELLSYHPLQAGPLLRLKDRAEKAAREAHLRDRTVPEDAYRHILWSYLVTRDFGAELAKEVTDAHEIGRTGNSYAERKMDEHNNAVGRLYAAKGDPESKILKLTRTDPRVVRSVDELHLKRDLLR
jgi:hypothetical protein